MRLFVAVDLDDVVRRQVSARAAELAERLFAEALVHQTGVTWVAPRNLHLTLRFIGEVSPTTGQAIVEAMREPLVEWTFEFLLGGLGMFPPAGAPRVLWTAVEHGAEPLIRLAREVNARLDRFDLRPDDRPFRAHLTLARFKRPPSPRLRAALANIAAGWVFPECHVEQVVLYESRLSPQGASYERAAVAMLAGDDPGSEVM